MYCSTSVFYNGLLFREDVGLGSGVTCYITTLHGYMGRDVFSTSMFYNGLVFREDVCVDSIIGFSIRGEMYCSTYVFS